jgi:lysophospholipase L1-like esterase
MSAFRYLALGDSYTIGEQVPLEGNFPMQAAALMRAQGIQMEDPQIVAKTGWTTDELQAGIREAGIEGRFDLVTLLIGVNNQYRGWNLDVYRLEFAQLLADAVDFANGLPQHVVVLSIPDWGATPFAEGRDRAKIAQEIDEFNAANAELAMAKGCRYLDITPSTRANAGTPGYLADDGLHPSGMEYAAWAARLSEIARDILVKKH